MSPPILTTDRAFAAERQMFIGLVGKALAPRSAYRAEVFRSSGASDRLGSCSINIGVLGTETDDLICSALYKHLT